MSTCGRKDTFEVRLAGNFSMGWYSRPIQGGINELETGPMLGRLDEDNAHPNYHGWKYPSWKNIPSAHMAMVLRSVLAFVAVLGVTTVAGVTIEEFSQRPFQRLHKISATFHLAIPGCGIWSQLGLSCMSDMPICCRFER